MAAIFNAGAKRRRARAGRKRSIGPAAKACRGRKGASFRACVRREMRR